MEATTPLPSKTSAPRGRWRNARQLAQRRKEDRSRRRRRPEVFTHYKAIERARSRGAVGYHSLAEWQAKLELFGHCCAYCGRGGIELFRSRIVPPSRGGSNAIDNVVPSCRPCNSRPR